MFHGLIQSYVTSEWIYFLLIKFMIAFLIPGFMKTQMMGFRLELTYPGIKELKYLLAISSYIVILTFINITYQSM